jgi:hypothetical protein
LSMNARTDTKRTSRSVSPSLLLAVSTALLAAVAAIVLGSGVALSQTAPSGTLDAHFFPSTFNSNSGVDPTLREAQTFTAVKSGEVTAAQAYLRTYSPGDLTMQITTVDSSGYPTNNVLASTTIADLPLSDISVDPPVLTGTFSNPASVVSGREYALVLSTTATNSPHTVWGTYVKDQPDEPYAGGEAMYRYDTHTVWQRRTEADEGQDWGFAIYVATEDLTDTVGLSLLLVASALFLSVGVLLNAVVRRRIEPSAHELVFREHLF